MAVIGIDLGTSNTLACVFQPGGSMLIPNRAGGFMTPSAVSVAEDGTVLVGQAARARLCSHPDRTAASYKIHMGTGRKYYLGGRPYLPEELSALVLGQIREDAQRFLGEPVEEAVISVPAYFNDNQRSATKLAAELAGLRVARLINEPSAAALCYRCTAPEARDGKLMVVDFGGGTLDVSIVECFENIVEIQAIAGDNRLGGDDIDMAIAQCFCRENGLSWPAQPPAQQAALLHLAEQTKRSLATPGATMALMSLDTPEGALQMGLNQDLLAQICAPVFKRVEKVLRAVLANREAAAGVRRVVLVGGSARLPVFQLFLEKLLSVKPVLAADPDRTVAMGAGLCAGIRERREELQDIVMTDVCPFSLGIAVCSHAGDDTPHMAVLIPRSSMLPVSQTSRFYTLHNGQSVLKFQVYQGEAYYASDNLKLGELEVQVPRGPAGSQSAALTFTYDINGILHIEALASGGDHQETVILNPQLHLTQGELQQAIARMAQLRTEARTAQQSPLFQRALDLFQSSQGPLRALLGEALTGYGMAVDSGEPIPLRRAETQLRQAVQALEEDPFLFLGQEGEDDEEEEGLDHA